jgi:Mlc titration factor MtfA (ptsG expression regulator)
MSDIQSIHTVLDKYFPYCKSLDSYAKDSLCSRVSNFIKRKEFIPKGDLSEVTEEMKIIVGAHYAWLTRGLTRITLDAFTRILIYPEEFFSGHSETHLDGEAHPSGVVVFAWKELAFGCLKSDDGYNPGFRTFANALALQNRHESSEEINFFDESKLASFSRAADKYFDQIQNGTGAVLLQNHGVEYRSQMFGACIELLFEMPDELSKNCPEISTSLKSLLYLTTY